MKKTLLLAVAVAALAISAFAAPPPSTASPPGAYPELAQAAKDVNPIALKSEDIAPLSQVVADSGSGAESAYRAWRQKDSRAQVPMPHVHVPDVHPHQRK